MTQELLSQALSSQGFAVAAFVVAIAALWRTLLGAFASRISALEGAVADCMRKHDECEQRNRDLSAAIVDVLEHRETQALATCRALLNENKPPG